MDLDTYIGHMTHLKNGHFSTPYLQDVLSDRTVFLDSACWFKLLQDEDKEMTRKEIIQYSGTREGDETKEKYKNIAHGGYFYPELYSLAGDVLALLETKQLEYFPCLLALQKKNVKYHLHYWQGDCPSTIFMHMWRCSQYCS